MSEVQFTLQETILRGHLHLPVDVERPVPGILIVPGFADTAVGPHNLHVALARALCRRGFAVLRFDYRGQGESDGDFQRFTAQSGYDDALAALTTLQVQPEVDALRLGIIGYSLGGTLACVLAAEVSAVSALLLLAPVAYPQPVFQTFFTPAHLAQARQRGWMDWLGWAVGQDYLPSLAVLDPLRSLQQSHAATLVLHGVADREVSVENGEAFAQHGAMLHRLLDGDHQFSSVVLQNEVIDRASAWFSRHWKQKIGAD